MAGFSKFYDYFLENMQGLGLPAPDEMYGNLPLALSNLTGMQLFIESHGAQVTVKELIGAGLRGDKLSAIGGMLASFYVSAVVGSIAVATGRCLGKAATMADVLRSAREHGFNSPWLAGHLARNPGMYDPTVSGRKRHRHHAAA
ncbi:hypothetical protein OOT46_06980 [Aquabacterium sp. A7-Y]|uniref:hypothetical protein n=1 Tax=Aquabacterium sp. A7-Y TaxID=1349605 RepID=UPI00223DA8F3|nr:hypothetical protein [Aquabacterium sp. A7-Y]MCW7537595.1 hypothetical protein [Aquabacterium sp. A7-Y]